MSLSSASVRKSLRSIEHPKGLPPVRCFRHQIDFVLDVSLPNRPAYRTNPVETKELQKQIGELLEKGYIRESLSPCAVHVLLGPKRMVLGACAWTVVPSITLR